MRLESKNIQIVNFNLSSLKIKVNGKVFSFTLRKKKRTTPRSASGTGSEVT